MSTHYDHDRNFKTLMAERSFYEPFIKAYLPQELLGRVDWAATELHKMSGAHTEQNSQKTFEADVIYLTKINGEVNFFWFHVEHQSTVRRESRMNNCLTMMRPAMLLAVTYRHMRGWQRPGVKLSRQ